MFSRLLPWNNVERRRTWLRSTVFLGLGLAAFGMNRFPFHLSPGADILLGSIFVVFAAILGGVPAAGFVSLCGGLQTYLMWKFPWAIPILFLEAVCVGYFSRRGRSPVVGILLYWPLIGLPFVILVYGWNLRLSLEFVWMIALADFLAGLLGAIVVHLLSTAQRLRFYAERLACPLPTYSLRSHILVSGLLFGILPLLLLLEYRDSELAQARESESRVRLIEVAETLDALIRSSAVPQTTLLSLRLDSQGGLVPAWASNNPSSGALMSPKNILPPSGGTFLFGSIPLLGILCFSSDGQLLLSLPEEKRPDSETARNILAAAQGKPSFEFRVASSFGSEKPRYLAASSANRQGGYVVIATQLASFAGFESRSTSKIALVWLTGTIVASLILGAWFSRRFTQSLQDLVAAMHASLGADGAIGDCPADATAEVRLLWRGFQKLQAKLFTAVQLHQLNERKALAAVTEKNSFMAAVSHELRGPMNSITGAAALMSSRSSSTPSLSIEEATEMIVRSSRQLISIIDDVADFSRLEAQTLPLRPSVFPLGPALADVVGWVNAEARRKRIEIGVFIGGGVPYDIVADRTRFAQILHNLLHNSVKFTDLGEIRVSIEVVQSDVGFLELGVEDTGDGISPELHDAVFEPFFHRSSSRATPRVGSGLGLAIVKGLVDQMGGTVALQSTPGIGTRVTIRLPLVPPGSAERLFPGPLPGVVFCMGRSLSRDALLSQSNHLGLPSRVAVFDSGCDWSSLVSPGASLFLDIDELPSSSSARQELFAAVDAAGFAHLVLVEAFAHPSPPPVPSFPLNRLAVHWLAWPPVLYNAQSFLQPGPSPLPASTAPASVQVPAETLNILVAEDDDDSRLVLQLALRRFGHTVFAVGNGAAVLDAVREKSFDVILLDIEMPIFGGTKLVGHIRQIPAFARTPIYAVTAHASEQYRAEFLAAGFTGHLAKPYTPEALQALVLGGTPPDPPAFSPSTRINPATFLQFAGLLQSAGNPVEPTVSRILSEVSLWANATPSPPSDLPSVLHPFIGSCSLIGASALAAYLRELSAPGARDDWDRDLLQLRTLLEESQKGFDEILARPPAG